ncbi:MAG TPA: DUF2937 family protein [Aestuariivirgaceae bacterium]|nr:DUF2937 family protein [Aestuariivirgaceae bacterium]
MRIVRIASAVVLALALSQFPEFVQQYVQRTGGAVDALQPLVERFEASAAQAGLSRQAALERLERNPDNLVVGQSAATADAIARYESLRQSYGDLASAGEFERLLVFGASVDPAIARRTMGDFRPAVPVTLEGLAHAGVGLVLGYGLGALIAAAAGALLGLRRRESINSPPAPWR